MVAGRVGWGSLRSVVCDARVRTSGRVGDGPSACLGGHGRAVLVHRSAPVLTVGVDRAVVETALRGAAAVPGGRVRAPAGAVGVGAGAGVRGAGRLMPRRGRCTGCRRTHVLLPASVLLRRADAVTVIGVALLAKARGRGIGGSRSWSGGRRRRCGVGCAGSGRSRPGCSRCSPRPPRSSVPSSWCRRRRPIRSGRWWSWSGRWPGRRPGGWAVRVSRGGWPR